MHTRRRPRKRIPLRLDSRSPPPPSLTSRGTHRHRTGLDLPHEPCGSTQKQHLDSPLLMPALEKLSLAHFTPTFSSPPRALTLRDHVDSRHHMFHSFNIPASATVKVMLRSASALSNLGYLRISRHSPRTSLATAPLSPPTAAEARTQSYGPRSTPDVRLVCKRGSRNPRHGAPSTTAGVRRRATGQSPCALYTCRGRIDWYDTFVACSWITDVSAFGASGASLDPRPRLGAVHQQRWCLQRATLPSRSWPRSYW